MEQVDKATSTSFESSRSTQYPEQNHDSSVQTLRSPLLSQVEADGDLDLLLNSCVKFIKKVSKIILDELENDSVSKAFSAWNGFDQRDQHVGKPEKSKITPIKLCYVIPYSHRKKRHPFHSSSLNAKLVKIDWNASGSFLVAVYGNSGEAGFSNGPGLIEVWGIRTNEEKQHIEKPTFSVEYESEVTTVVCHPQNPDVFAVGTATGEIAVYEIDEQHRLCTKACVSKVGDYFHDAAITSMYISKTDREWTLFSIGFDGKMLLWSLRDKLTYPIKGFTLRSETGSKSESENQIRPYFVGTAMSCYDEGSIKVICIGCDCGRLLVSTQPQLQSLQKNDLSLSLKWSPNAINVVKNIRPLHRAKVIKRAENQAKLKKKKGVDSNILYELGVPIDMIYPPLPNLNIFHPHWGRINSVDNCDGCFLSTGEDCMMTLYHPLRYSQSTKGRHTYPTLSESSSSFFHSEPLAGFHSDKVVLSCTKDGSFCLHDKTDSSSHDFSTMISNIMSESAVSHVAINKGKNRVAISCSDGSISIWKL